MTLRDRILYEVYKAYYSGINLTTDKLIDKTQRQRTHVYDEVKKLVEKGLIERIKGDTRDKILRPVIKSEQVLLFLYKLNKEG